MEVDPGAIGREAQPLTVPPEEAERFQEAVREATRRRIVALLKQRGLLNSPTLQACSVCGDKIISLDEPSTFAFERGTYLCAACAAERSLVTVINPPADIGGEG